MGDIGDPHAVELAARDCEVLIHVAAASPSGPEGPLGAERVRVEGCRNLLRAARKNGARRVVVGSGYWVYADNAGTITEGSPLDPRGESRVNRDTELVALDPSLRGDVEVVVVRPGMVYGNGSWFRPIVEGVHAGTYRYIADGSNPWSFVSLDDAGSGFARVAESGVPGEVYNLVDGRPVPWRELVDEVADRLHRPHPTAISMEEAARELGPEVAHHLHARRACSAAKIGSLGWTPRDPDVRAGLARLWPSMKIPEP